MAPTDPLRCSAAALYRGDPLAGTAPVASRWLLIEHQGPWAKKPTDTEPMFGAVGAEVDARAASFGGKVLLVRRPGRRAPGVEEQHWFAVDTVRRTWVRGTWRTAADLLEAARALGAALSASHEEAEPMVLVCTHGIRDACCAVRGRPIVNALARAFPDQVWETTHLGGHRFAGTLLTLPDGACFGRLDPASAAQVVGAHRQGRTDPAHLRGTTRWEPAVQAALVAALERARPGIRRRPGAGGHRGGWRAHDGRGDRSRHRCRSGLVVDVVTEALPDAALSCGDRPKAARRAAGRRAPLGSAAAAAVPAWGHERDGAVPRGT